METKKRIGRPPKADAVRKRKNQTFRIRDEMLAQLSSAAAVNQRSISEEIESRLEQSFRRAADPHLDAALRMTAANCQVILELLGKKIGEDEFALMSCAEAAKSAFMMAGNLARADKDALALARELMRPETELLGENVARLVMEAYSKDRSAYEATKDTVDGIVQRRKEVEALADAPSEQQEPTQVAAAATKGHRLLLDEIEPASAPARSQKVRKLRV